MKLVIEQRDQLQTPPGFIKANVFHGPGNFSIDEKRIPIPAYGEAVIKVRLTTICGTDIHLIKGEYPVNPGLTIRHEAMGVRHELGPGVTSYEIGQRVLVGAITPCGQCDACLRGRTSQCGGALGGWRLGNAIDGTQAESVVIPYTQANLTSGPDELRDEEVLLLADIASSGFAAYDLFAKRKDDVLKVAIQVS
jgi:threonine dehydrogenase-like Zn-dependent dehydrogenase